MNQQNGRNQEMMKNLCSLNYSVEEEMGESKKGRRHPLQTWNMLPTLPAFPVPNHCTLHQLLPHTFHHTYSPESHLYLHIAHFTPSISPISRSYIIIMLALTWIVTQRSSFLSSLTLTLNYMMLIYVYHILCVDLARLAIHCIYPILTILSMLPICCTCSHSP